MRRFGMHQGSNHSGQIRDGSGGGGAPAPATTGSPTPTGSGGSVLMEGILSEMIGSAFFTSLLEGDDNKKQTCKLLHEEVSDKDCKNTMGATVQVDPKTGVRMISGQVDLVRKFQCGIKKILCSDSDHGDGGDHGDGDHGDDK